MRYAWMVLGLASGFGVMMGMSWGQTQPAKVAPPATRAAASGTQAAATGQATTGTGTAGATGPAASQEAAGGAAAGGVAAGGAQMPQSLETDIKDCIALLEAGKNRELIERLAEPAMVQRMKETGEFDQLVASFGGPRAAKALTMLKAALEQTPVITEDGTAATFPTMADSPKLEFHLIGGNWRLK